NIHIYIGKDPDLKALVFPDEKDTISIAVSETETYLNNALQSLEKKGYSLAKMQLVNIRKNGNSLVADLNIDTGKPRVLNDIVLNGYDKFPEGHKKNIRRLYKNKTFNQQTLQDLHNDINKFRFINQTKYPEILFTTDTTKVYVYVEKAKPSRFDGLIGFANDDENSKIVFSGYLDLLLVNFANTGEEFSLYWKSDGKEQRTFNVGLELPYIFKSRFGLKAALNIFKQDSTFQNTKTALDIGYYFNYNTRLYLGYQATESSDIQNQNNFSINDYKNKFATLNLDFVDFKVDDFLFPEKTRLYLKAGVGSRNSNLQDNSQIFVEANLRHNFYLNDKNVVNIKSLNYYLSSQEYIINELYRFGGINSIRGFNENSLQANFVSSILTEYRYILAPNLYVHSIIDYGYFIDETSDLRDSILGLGFGFGLQTKTGLLNLVYANGSTGDQPIKLSNSIVHISLKANF
ncbi:BamA/TamA family outer membrane protein, partial [Flavobacterium sp.]|uniref:BamA/TamA family outer membrane protein n=1 Tax=Flavobacterium sp. TaxID=239 RepID=UPI0025C671A9